MQGTPMSVGSPQEVIEKTLTFQEGFGDSQRQLWVVDAMGLPVETALEQVSSCSATRSRATRGWRRAGRVSQKEFALLTVLAAEPTRVFTSEELLRNVWGFRTMGSTRTTDSHALGEVRSGARLPSTPVGRRCTPFIATTTDVSPSPVSAGIFEPEEPRDVLGEVIGRRQHR
jgi:Transcriptional regulatory protein, C terminal